MPRGGDEERKERARPWPILLGGSRTYRLAFKSREFARRFVEANGARMPGEWRDRSRIKALRRRFAPGEIRATYGCRTMSTEISTAGVVPLFSSQCLVLLSSGQPTPGP